MTLKDEISAAVTKTFAEVWKSRDGTKVPDPPDIGLSNDAVKLDGTVLYADLSGSTVMVDKMSREFSAEIYKTYLYATARVIKSMGGEIVAYDGDRVMAIFIGDSKNSDAAKCALKIHYAVKEIVMPAMKKQYPNVTFEIRHVVGIDTSELFVARTGVRGDNDLVWVGPAANYAAKLTELDSAFPTWITHRVYDKLNAGSKIAGDGRNMWVKKSWNTMGGLTIYSSAFWWTFS